MNLPTILVAILVAAVFLSIVMVSIRNRKNGKSSCSGCNGCSGCGMKDSCHH